MAGSIVRGVRMIWHGFLLVMGVAAAAPSWKQYQNHPDDWFRNPEELRITTNILSWQSPHGSWPKNMDTGIRPRTEADGTIQGSFDNGATTDELRFLARAYRATGDSRCREAFLRGLDGILKAQYPTGGWPQYYPPPNRSYHRHITFNDGTMVRLMEFLREVAGNPGYEFVEPARRAVAKASFDRGIECILKCQVLVNGTSTVWCAQHDELNYQPRSGRSYELVSLSGAESAGILRLLMIVDRPRPEVIRAIEAGVKWFENARITGIRVVQKDGDRMVVPDPAAPPLWARFYEMETNRPIFSGRDGVKKYHLAEIDQERRNGYRWYGSWGEQVALDHARWKQRLRDEKRSQL